jgi:2-amino-4-hydroxy-6-hydroxymethyldihydropteridine diphosphokinase
MNIEYPDDELVVLSIGSNLGDRIENINNCIDLLINLELINDTVRSSFYESEPIGFTSQPKFINIALIGRTCYLPNYLLFFTKSIEYFLGRVKREKWHEREIDIDIIFYGNHIIENQYLTIPHKEMINRKFVLLPLAEIDKSLIHPIYNIDIETLLANCKDNSKIKKINVNDTKRNNK